MSSPTRPADPALLDRPLVGPADVSALSVSAAAWRAMEQNPGAPGESVLSLLDLRDGWLRTDRSVLLGTPASLETAAFDHGWRWCAPN